MRRLSALPPVTLRKRGHRGLTRCQRWGVHVMTHVVESATVEIDAPDWFVWGVLVDYARYPEWNEYTISVETRLQVGDVIDLTLPNPDGSPGTFVNREFIRIVDPPVHLRYDTGDLVPGLLGSRDQY